MYLPNIRACQWRRLPACCPLAIPPVASHLACRQSRLKHAIAVAAAFPPSTVPGGIQPRTEYPACGPVLLTAAPQGLMLHRRFGVRFCRLARLDRQPGAAGLTTGTGGLTVGKRSFAPTDGGADEADAEPRLPHFAMPRWEPIRELDPATMTAERMRAECIDAEQPAVFRGVAADWPAVSGPRAWTDWDRLGKLYGHNMVSVEQGEVFYAADALAGMRVPFGLYLIYMHEAAKPAVLEQMHRQLPKMYLGQVDLFADVPEMRDDVKLPDFA